MIDLGRQEQAWHEILRLLRAAGAVTDADLQSSVRAAPTPGQDILTAIRCWGSLLVRLERENDRA